MKHKDGYVYFIATDDGRFVKIGTTKGPPEWRMRSIQTGCPSKLRLLHFVLSDRAYDLEVELHAKFVHQHIHGEWFLLNEQIQQFINSCPEVGSDTIPVRPEKTTPLASGALWRNAPRNGVEVLRGNILVSGHRLKITARTNFKGQNPRRPDYLVYVDKDSKRCRFVEDRP